MKGAKKFLKFIIYIVVSLLMLIVGTTSKAATQSPTLYFGITELRTMSKPNLGYSIGNPDTGGTTTTAAKIWNIVKYSDDNYSDPTEVNVYCVKAGVGFSDTSKEQSYNVKYNMKTERTAIAAQNDVLNKLVNNGQYNNLLALADLIYLPGVSTAEERAKLLDDAGIADGEGEFALTDDDIKATQQAAMWYFTNYGEENDKYNKYGKTSWIWYTEDGKTYKNFESYNPTSAPPNEGAGITRAGNMQLLYEYLIDEAKKNGPAYENGNAEPHTVLTLYASTGNNQAQPLMEIQRTPKEFDLALRKYITKVNDVNVAVSRVPNIDESTLGTGTTATYKHKKDPVKVKTGDKVTYNITIYNEGEIAGRASKIVDQLPTGLKFSKVITSGYTSDYNDSTNRLTLTKTGTNNLAPYENGTLSSETIQIECTVEVIGKGQILTNVAWISEEIDENGTVITNQEGKDRDSEPSTTPSVNKDNMENYRGNTNNKTDLTDSTYFYKGEQDDDDFEKLIVEKVTGNYQLQLEKVDKDSPSTKLQGAEFKVTLPNTSTPVTKTTGANGLVDFGTINITSVDSADTITIEETKAPSGYNKIIGQMQIQVDKEYSNGKYIAKSVKILSGGVTGAEVTLSNNIIKVVVPDEKITGSYKIQLEKVDKDDNTVKLEGAEFEVFNTPSVTGKRTVTTGPDGMVDLGTVQIYDTTQNDVIMIEETKAPEGYNKILDSMEIQVQKEVQDGKYVAKSAQIVTGAVEGTSVKIEDNIVKITVADEKITGDYQIQLEKVDKDNNQVKLQGAEFAVTLPGESQSKTVTTGQNGIVNLGTVTITDVNTNDTMTIEETKAPDGYNKILGTATLEIEKEVVDGSYKATGVQITSGGQAGITAKVENNVIKITVQDEKITGDYQIQLEKVDKNDNKIKLENAEFQVTLPGEDEAKTVTTNEDGIIDLGVIPINGIETNDHITVKETKAPDGYKALIDSLSIEVQKQIQNGKYVAKQATITAGGVEGATVTVEDNVVKIKIPNERKEFDLSLRKYITKVGNKEYDREPQVDTTNLTENTDTTSEYNHSKQPIEVQRKSIITYTIRVYNEGEVDGYASEVTDYLPEELEFVADNEINRQYGWQLGEDGRTVTTNYLSQENEETPGENLLKAFDGENLDYKDLQIVCRVKEDAEIDKKLTNLAEITEDNNEFDFPDRDSTPDNVEKPSDEDLPGYKDDEIDKDYVPGQEDDDDFEKVIVKQFDLALRKFITNVEGTNTIDEDDSQGVTDTQIGNVTDRIPEVSYDRENNKITYNHKKDPVEVVTGNIVTYTIRVYNEGDINGYANLISDDIPDGLKFLPENETNVEYRWVMYDESGNVTENVEEAVKIETDYLSKEQGEENLLHAFNKDEEISETNPDYKDVKVAFEIVEPNGSDKILVNSAQISDDSDENGDPVEDIDSTPDEWNEGEDDQDREYVKLTYFDLALRKWVTEAIVIEDGKQTITQTGHTPEMNPEPVVKVELYRKNINDVTVKFRYSIRITNEGDIAGYAKEITDYVPEGLRFIAEDNPGWTDEGNNVISTRLLENTLLQPGEYADVEVVLTWINGEDNMGEKVNIAEISEDYNDKGVPDRDSTPDNQKPGEDDIDDAPVLLSIETGAVTTYFTLTLIILVAVAGGVFLIKRYVL